MEGVPFSVRFFDVDFGCLQFSFSFLRSAIASVLERHAASEEVVSTIVWRRGIP